MFPTSASNPPPLRFKDLVVLLATGSSTQRDWSPAEAGMSLSRTCPCTGSCGLFYIDRGLASTKTTDSCASSNLLALTLVQNENSCLGLLLWEESCPGKTRSSSGTTHCPGHKHFCTVQATLQDRYLSRGLLQRSYPRQSTSSPPGLVLSELLDPRSYILVKIVVPLCTGLHGILLD